MDIGFGNATMRSPPVRAQDTMWGRSWVLFLSMNSKDNLKTIPVAPPSRPHLELRPLTRVHLHLSIHLSCYYQSIEFLPSVSSSQGPGRTMKRCVKSDVVESTERRRDGEQVFVIVFRRRGGGGGETRIRFRLFFLFPKVLKANVAFCLKLGDHQITYLSNWKLQLLR